MIRCTKCQAPVDWADHACWHCQAGLDQHPLRTDMRYWLAYSQPSRLIFNLAVTLVFLYLFVGAILSPFSRSFIETIGMLVCFGIPLSIALLRLALRERLPRKEDAAE